MSDDIDDDELRRTFSKLGFVTTSPRTTALLRRARRAASLSDLAVLLEGETGTGKGIMARAIHQLDPKRCGAPFVTMHCGSVCESLAESELFGHQRGAFSGAVSHRQGLFRAANRGTLLLDDVNDLPPALQAKLLDVLQRGIVRPLGSDQETVINVRVMAASNTSLSSLVEQNRFRRDLYHRLNVVKLVLPPLRERSEDLSGLLLALTQRHGALYRTIERVDPQLLRLLESKPFFGNTRELETAVKRMLFLKNEGRSLDLADWEAQADESESELPCDPAKAAADVLWKAISERGLSYARALRDTEKCVLQIALDKNGQRRQVAQLLRTTERTLYYKMRLHGLGRRLAT